MAIEAEELAKLREKRGIELYFLVGDYICRHTEAWNPLSTEGLKTRLCRNIFHRFRLRPPHDPIADYKTMAETVRLWQKTDYIEVDCVKAFGGTKEHEYLFPHIFPNFSCQKLHRIL